jgi:hypothetical protein
MAISPKRTGDDTLRRNTGVGICLKILRHFAYFAARVAATFGTRPRLLALNSALNQVAHEL